MTFTTALASDVVERFLSSIVETVDSGRIVELHLFPPMRQGGIETGVAVLAALPEQGEKHVVYSARYRWTRKGIERGKWEHEVVAEADAPLVTVEAVVQGVQRRSNEQSEPDRMTGDQIRAILQEAERRQCQANQ